MVNGLFANKGPQAVKADGANTQQHFLKWGKEPSGLCGAAGCGLAMIWIPELENGPEGLTGEGRKGRTSREKFKTSVSDTLWTWWLLLMVAGAAQKRGCCWEAELHPHLSEFPLSWKRLWWKSIFTLLFLQAWKKWNRDNTSEGTPKEETSKDATGRGRKSSPCPAQSCFLLQTIVVQKPFYCRILGIGGMTLR